MDIDYGNVLVPREPLPDWTQARLGRFSHPSERRLGVRWQPIHVSRELVLGLPQPGRHATAGSRHLAIAADTELRRRHPLQTIEPLLSAEPAPASDTRCDGKLSQMATGIRDLAGDVLAAGL